MFEPTAVERVEELEPELRRRLFPDESAIPEEVDRRVAEIVRQVRTGGDEVLSELSLRFDNVDITPGAFHLAQSTIDDVADRADSTIRDALDKMIANVRRFHEPQRRRGYELDGPDGVRLAWRLRPVGSVAVYVPGGLAAYPTTVVMNVVPAQIAGVGRIVALTPPGSVERNPAIAYALRALNVEEVIALGGAQAIAAAAYGTESIRPVDVIVGPGNAYVAAAKRQVFGVVGIDSIAGPSEVVILADESAPADWVVQDLVAQAEHDEIARCILITTSAKLAHDVSARMPEAVESTPRADIARASILANGANCIVPNLAVAVALTNAIAPEHLQVMVADSAALSPDDFVAGATFWGHHTPTAVGDYWAGPNHVLPTGSTARFKGPLGVDDFLVPMSVVQYSGSAARAELGPAKALAEAEGLFAHADSLGCRLKEEE